jgi:hypothetical protein
MPKPDLENIDAMQIFLHARGFFLAEETIGNINMSADPQLAGETTQAMIVISALASELFLKCIVCVETGLTPQGHYLDYLFSRLSPKTQARIQHIWDTDLVPFREPMWKRIEATFGNGETLKRDLPSALAAASRAFEKTRYSYEGDSSDTQFYISDLPRLLGRVILELKPEWANLRRRVKPVP